jgi:hypothetical protein
VTAFNTSEKSVPALFTVSVTYDVDNPEDVRTTADLGDEDKRLPKGDFGDYCPVTYVKDNWLAKGDP